MNTYPENIQTSAGIYCAGKFAIQLHARSAHVHFPSAIMQGAWKINLMPKRTERISILSDVVLKALTNPKMILELV